ncbi:hypothetical protein DSL72_004958 [Monilinia vaccinii-corymbosi]|uniref:RING-type domain-containing protein n=1 Tax=Monilinia vaccinii-corymbosi TaxID=61207 RepID=A0A8A3NXN8_9HELO|nr:hypothetical protein DSL72_004958 [Monilinia vaccinii-corymbosi]
MPALGSYQEALALVADLRRRVEVWNSRSRHRINRLRLSSGRTRQDARPSIPHHAAPGTPLDLQGRSMEQLLMELSALDHAEVNELGPALNDSSVPFHDDDDIPFDLQQGAHPQDISWYLRKAAVEALLLPVDKPAGEIDPCFCSDPYAITTATGDCHAPAMMPTCGHVFGRSCIAAWLQRKNTCPMCRNELALPRLCSG